MLYTLFPKSMIRPIWQLDFCINKPMIRPIWQLGLFIRSMIRPEWQLDLSLFIHYYNYMFIMYNVYLFIPISLVCIKI